MASDPTSRPCWCPRRARARCRCHRDGPSRRASDLGPRALQVQVAAGLGDRVDPIRKMREWMIAQGIATAQEEAVEAEDLRSFREVQRRAWDDAGRRSTRSGGRPWNCSTSPPGYGVAGAGDL